MTISKLALTALALLGLASLRFGPPPAFRQSSHKHPTAKVYGNVPLAFEPNEGQAETGVKFLARGPGYSLSLAVDQAVLALYSVSGPHLLGVKLVGANTAAKLTGEKKLPGKSNYFIGNDPLKWRTNVPNYAKVRYEQVYPGVDVVYYGNQQQLEYDFVLAPGADPRSIQLAFEGADRLEIDAAGDLLLRAAGEELRFRKPRIYQHAEHGSQEVPGRYVVHRGRQISFDVGSYDSSQRLVIDPILVYSTLSAGDSADAIAVDSSGNAYVTGSTSYYDEPWYYFTATVTKLNAEGSLAIYTTKFGTGTSYSATNAQGIAVDGAGNAYVTGSTRSSTFPTRNAIQPKLRGEEDAFVMKLDPSGLMVYSTYIGGSGLDYGYGIAVDSTGSAYVAGSTASSDFPTANALEATHAGSYYTAFVSKLNPAGSAFVYSTYLGASAQAEAYSIAVDPAGNAYMAGLTRSANFPTVNPLQARLGGPNSVTGTGEDGFVAKLNAAGTALVYSTFLGGKAYDKVSGIAVDSDGNAYVTGCTYSDDFPLANALQRVFGGPGGNAGDAFVAKLNASGSALVYSTYLGGSGSDGGSAIAVDSVGNAYVTGWTGSVNFPATNPVQSASGGSYDAFVAELSAAGSALVYSTYLGGSRYDSGTGVAVDAAGNAYIAGQTQSSEFPLTNPLQKGPTAGSRSGFVMRIGAFSPPDPVVVLSKSTLTFANQIVGTTSSAQSVTIWNSGTTAVLSIFSIEITGPNRGDFTLNNSCGSSLAVNASCAMTVTFAPTAAGTRTASIVIADNASNNPQTITLVGIAPTVVLSSTRLAFGGQLVGTAAPAQTIVMTNYGAVALSITSISIVGTNSADFALLFNNCGTSLATGMSCTISVSYAPGTAGAATASITIVDNAPGSPHTISLTGTGLAPALRLTADRLAFANQAVGSTSATAQRVIVDNTGTAALVITDLSISGSNATDFVFSSTGTTCRSAVPVAPGLGCVISVLFSPTGEGARTASVVIAHNAAGSPHRITLTGTGLIAVPAVTLSPTSLLFASQLVGTSSTAQTVVLKNSGTAALKIASIAISGANPAEFAQTNDCGTSVAASASCTITVRFTPTAAGARTALLALTDDAPNSPQTVNLTGTGILPALASGGVVNGASFAPNQPLAAGSIASLFGTSLAPSTTYAVNTPLPKTLGGISVTVTTGAGSFQAPLFFISPSQINLQLPWELVGQSQATLTVTFGGVSSNSITVAMTAASPGIFSLNSQGSGPGAILVSGSADLAQPSGSVLGRTARPAKRGEYISIYCTGLGAVSNQPANGAAPASSPSSITPTTPIVTIGGVPAPVTFSGLAPSFVGLYQVNAQVPDSAAPGSAVPVALTIGSVTSNTVTIAVQ